jgi:hypothetical protein
MTKKETRIYHETDIRKTNGGWSWMELNQGSCFYISDAEPESSLKADKRSLLMS